MRDSEKLAGRIYRNGAALMVGLLIVSGLFGCGDDKNQPPDYKAILKDASRYVAEIEQKNEKLAARVEALTKKDNGTAKAQTDEDIRATLDELMAENQILAEEKEALAAELAELKSGKDQAVTKKITELEAKNRSLAEKKKVYEKEIAKLRKKVRENEGIAETVKKLEQANEKLTEQKASLEEEIADLRAELGKAEKMATELENLKAENKRLADLNKAIESRMEDIRKMMSGDQSSKTKAKHK